MDIEVTHLWVCDRALLLSPSEGVFSRMNKPNLLSLSSWEKYSNIKPSWWPYTELCPVNSLSDTGSSKLGAVLETLSKACWVEEYDGVLHSAYCLLDPQEYFAELVPSQSRHSLYILPGAPPSLVQWFASDLPEFYELPTNLFLQTLSAPLAGITIVPHTRCFLQFWAISRSDEHSPLPPPLIKMLRRTVPRTDPCITASCHWPSGRLWPINHDPWAHSSNQFLHI